MNELPRFTSQLEIDDAAKRRWDLESPILPGMTWAEGNMFTDSSFMTNCDMENAIFTDTVWGGNISPKLELQKMYGGQLLQEIFYSDPLRRLHAVEQLTMPPHYSTVPNTGGLPRSEHVWGSVLLVEQISEKYGIPDEQKLILQLRTLVSDVAHTFGSHLGDWLFQGVGGGENQHDLELLHYLNATGVSDILAKYGIRPEDVVFPKINDWVEADQPDLCVDRADYGLREMKRWNQVISSQGFSSEDFILTPENMLAMPDQQRARLFAEGFLLLSQENWSEPTHRAVLDLYMLRTKLFYAQGRAPSTWVFKEDISDGALVDLQEIHPRDLMYVTDPAQLRNYAYPDLVGNTLESMMSSISRYHRQYVWPRKNNRINAYMSQFLSPSYERITETGRSMAYGSAEFDTFRDSYPDTLPGFAILDGIPEANDLCIDIVQQPFKSRQIDPLVKTAHGFERLSVLDSSFAERLVEHKQAHGRIKTARFAVPDQKTRDMLRATIANVENHWQERLTTSRRMSDAELRALVGASARDVFGQYPFMTFRS